MRVAIKAVGTVLVAILLSYPLWAPAVGRGFLGEIGALGKVGAPIAVAVFFGLVALYCRALQRTMTLLRPDARAASPASVWWMFAIPYNFIEDFFIVTNVSASLAADARIPSGHIRCWAVLGYGWCVFQIVSLFPGGAALIGAAIALPLWAAHWVMTGHVNRTLARAQQTSPIRHSVLG